MPHYLLRWQFTSNSAKSMVSSPVDRTIPAKALIEGFGGKLEAYYFSFGEFDGVGLVEFPDNTSVAACSLTAASSGGFSKFETTVLFTAKDGEAAMKKEHDTNTGYRPPNA